MTHPEIQAEQRHFDRTHARLEAMREAARNMVNEVIGLGKGGTHQARLERDALVEISVRRVASLSFGTESVIFGRIDRDDGDTYYIGRVAVQDEDLEPLAVDWRAPAAEPFYRATPRVPLGLQRRRHFVTRGRQIVHIDDELLGEGAADRGDLVLMGEAALMAALERSRTGRMRDIVATIQAEQDEIIRAPLPGVLVVQGGPGTGKTAVALHRAAYLLHTHRRRLSQAGVLVVGPNPVFLRYIDQVLPSLGEEDVVLATVTGLVPDVSVTGVDSPAAARVKGDARMVEVLARAVQAKERPLSHPMTIEYGREEIPLSPGATRRIVEAARREPGGHNARRAAAAAMLVDALYATYRGAREREGGDALPAAHPKPAFARAIRRSSGFGEALGRIWPRLDPLVLVHELLTSRSLLAEAAAGVLTPEEQQAILRAPGEGPRRAAWTRADVALIDEAAVVIGKAVRPKARPRQDDDDGTRELFAERVMSDLEDLDPAMRQAIKERLLDAQNDDLRADDDGEMRTFGHVIVDEAQDVTPMEWRLIGRRSRTGSMTILGDLGQASGAWAARDWLEALASLPTRAPRTVVELTINYRTPAEIMDVAGAILEASNPELSPPRSVRATGELPEVVRTGDVAGALSALVAAELSTVEDGMVAVVAPRALLAPARAALGLDIDDAATLDDRVTVLGVDDAKGLEFDSVVVVEPSAVVAEHPNGLRALYVTLTRATKRLTIVHASPLPDALVAGLERAAHAAAQAEPAEEPALGS